jgi:hypothetical protein
MKLYNGKTLPRHSVGNRPGRVEPRALKRRPKPYDLLNKKNGPNWRPAFMADRAARGMWMTCTKANRLAAQWKSRCRSSWNSGTRGVTIKRCLLLIAV